MQKKIKKSPCSFLKSGLLMSILSVALAHGQTDSTLVQYGNALSDLNEKKLYETAVDVFQSYFLVYPEGKQSADVHWALAQFQMKQNKYDRAYVNFLKAALLYPASLKRLNAREEAGTAVTKDYNLKPIQEKLLSLFDDTMEDSTVSGRYFGLLNHLRDLIYPKLNDALIPECRLFIQLYPEHPGVPQLSLWMGDMYQENKDYWMALASYLRIIHMYPKSDAVLTCKIKAADLYGANLKEYDQAIVIYREVTRGEADSSMKAEAQWNLARITEEKLLNPSSAAEEYQNLADLYPFSPNVPEALMRKANLQDSQLRQYEGSIAVCRFIADRFPDSHYAPEALAKAGEVYEKRMKDYEKAIQIYEELSARYTKNPLAAEKLYDAADLAEKKLKDKDRAVQLYQKVADTYPEESLGKKSIKKIESLKK